MGILAAMISFYICGNADWLDSLALGAAVSDFSLFPSSTPFNELRINVPGRSVFEAFPCIEVSLDDAKRFSTFLNQLIEKCEKVNA